MNFNFFGKKAEKSEPEKERFSDPTRNTQGDQYSYSPRNPPQPISILGPHTSTASSTKVAKKVRFGDKSVQKPFDLPPPRQTRPVRLSKKERDQPTLGQIVYSKIEHPWIINKMCSSEKVSPCHH